ncbi:hypothetical protein BaRGS_00024427 [Batillaria attramentaria]|uniref:Uncharacterized protein n=1 Tax=Batillaria attramentaria TaxID=370345 RepID=A0ABD0KB46_9CAEN
MTPPTPASRYYNTPHSPSLIPVPPCWTRMADLRPAQQLTLLGILRIRCDLDSTEDEKDLIVTVDYSRHIKGCY